MQLNTSCIDFIQDAENICMAFAWYKLKQNTILSIIQISITIAAKLFLDDVLTGKLFL